MRLFTVTVVTRRFKQADKHHFAERKVVLANSIEEARVLGLQDEPEDSVHAVGVEDHGSDRLVDIGHSRFTTKQVIEHVAKVEAGTAKNPWIVVEADPVMPKREPFKLK